jgi:hypothetical protein
MIVFGDLTHGVMIARGAQTGFDPNVDGCVARTSGDGQLLGGFVVTNYNGAIAMVHMAGSPGWCSPRLMWVLFDYSFNYLKLRRLLCTVGSKNLTSLDQVKRAGFVYEHTIKDGTPDGDLVMLSMSRPNCKWLKLRSRYLRENGHGELADVHA